MKGMYNEFRKNVEAQNGNCDVGADGIVVSVKMRIKNINKIAVI